MKRVLIVDDEPNVSRMLERSLRIKGIEAVPVDSTKAARTMAALQNFDAVLVDVLLKSENGWDTLRLLREVCDAPILMMTGAEVTEEMRDDARALGAREVLQKPFGVDELLLLLRTLPGWDPA